MATPVYSQSAIRYRLHFDFVNDELTFIDSLQTEYNTLYGFVLANMKGLARVTDPSGSVIYQNAGWATDDFSSPDITQDGTWEKLLGNIPVDVYGTHLKGNYIAEYKVTNGVRTDYVSRDMYFDYADPEVTINLSANCLTSQLTSADVSTYNVSHNGTTISPLTISRLHKLVQPDGSGWTWGAPNPDQTTSETVRIIGGGGTASSDLWTRVWQSSITTDLTYVLEYWGAYPLIQVTTEVSGLDDIDVRCNVLSERLYNAYTAFIGRWTDAVGRTSGGIKANRVVADRLAPKVIELQAEYQKFLIARENGDDTTASYNRIIEILSSEALWYADDEASQHIVPLATGIGGSVGGSTFNFGIGTTVPVGGNAEDKYIQYAVDGSSYILWSNQSGTWVNFGDLKGDAGDAARSAKVIYADFTDVPLVANSGDVMVFEKNLDLSSLDVALNDIIEIEVGIQTAGANPLITLFHKLNDTLITSLASYSVTPVTAETYLMKLSLVANTNAGASTYPRFTYSNASSTNEVKGYGSVNIDIIGETTLNYKFFQNKVDASAVASISVNYFVVKHIPAI
jgi:hypothetical protein